MKKRISVIPAKAGIQLFQIIENSLESGFHRSDDFYEIIKVDGLVKSLKRRISVIPAKAGIQLYQILKKSLDSGFHRSDDFLRDHQNYNANFPKSKII